MQNTQRSFDYAHLQAIVNLPICLLVFISLFSARFHLRNFQSVVFLFFFMIWPLWDRIYINAFSTVVEYVHNKQWKYRKQRPNILYNIRIRLTLSFKHAIHTKYRIAKLSYHSIIIREVVYIQVSMLLTPTTARRLDIQEKRSQQINCVRWSEPTPKTSRKALIIM